MARFLAALACTVAVVGCSGGSDGEPPAWNHNPNDTTLGPRAWGEIDEAFEECLAGKEQSPVDIAGAVPADLPDLEFDYPDTPVTVANTGHTIEASIPESRDLTLTIDGVEYRLRQFHFHAPSEHTVDGKSYDTEVHLVHESGEGEIAVITVFLERSELEITFVPSVLESAPEVAGEEVELDLASPIRLLGVADATNAYGGDYATYAGSLTTPGCTEGVRWIVTSGAMPTSPAAIDRLHGLIADFPGYVGYENNNRPTQPLNDRVIQRDASG